MKASFIVGIIFRLFAINWLVVGIGKLMSAFTVLEHASGRNLSYILSSFSSPGIYLTMAILAWLFAPMIASKVVGSADPEFKLDRITPTNLYTLGLVCIGSYAALNYFGNLLSILQYLPLFQPDAPSHYYYSGSNIYYSVLAQLIPLFAGVAIAVSSASLARKLERSARRREAQNTAVSPSAD